MANFSVLIALLTGVPLLAVGVKAPTAKSAYKLTRESSQVLTAIAQNPQSLGLVRKSTPIDIIDVDRRTQTAHFRLSQFPQKGVGVVAFEHLSLAMALEITPEELNEDGFQPRTLVLRYDMLISNESEARKRKKPFTRR